MAKAKKATAPIAAVKPDEVTQPTEAQIALQQAFQLLVTAAGKSDGNAQYHVAVNQAVHIVATSLGYKVN